MGATPLEIRGVKGARAHIVGIPLPVRKRTPIDRTINRGHPGKEGSDSTSERIDFIHRVAQKFFSGSPKTMGKEKQRSRFLCPSVVRPGFMRETAHGLVIERLGEDGPLPGFSIIDVSRLSKKKPLLAQTG